MNVDYTAATELETPIKVSWTGYARGRIHEYNGDFDRDKSDRYCDAMERQKTNVVIRTVEEATAVASELEEYDSSQRAWMNSSMDGALDRVKSEVIDAMDERGYEVVRNSYNLVVGFEESEGEDTEETEEPADTDSPFEVGDEVRDNYLDELLTITEINDDGSATANGDGSASIVKPSHLESGRVEFEDEEPADEPVTIREEETFEGYELPPAPEDEEDEEENQPAEGDEVTVEFETAPGVRPKETLTGTVTRSEDWCFEFVQEDGSEDYDYLIKDTDRIRVYDNETIYVYHPDRGTMGLTQLGQRAEVIDEDDDSTLCTDGGVSPEDMEPVDAEEFDLGEAVHAIVQPVDPARRPVDLRGTVVDLENSEDSLSLTIDTGTTEYLLTTSHVYKHPTEDRGSIGSGFDELKGTSYTLFRDTPTSTDGGTLPSCSECDYEGDAVELTTRTEEVEEVVSSRYDSQDPRYDPETRTRLEGYEVPLCPTCRGEEVEEVSA